MDFPVRVREILQALEEAGFEGFCVGGGVRDSLLGRDPMDWDIATNALPEQVLQLFAPHAIPTGWQHGTVTVTGSPDVEVTTYRQDGVYLDNRHPQSVSFVRSITEDLARRDFTVNAIAVDAHGQLHDPFGGREDLQSGILRAVGEPERRFREDGLRILRGLRFASQLGFTIESDTADAMLRCRDLLNGIAVERIRTEMTGLLCGAHPAEVLLDYAPILGVFLPEILPCVGFDQQNRHHCYTVWEHIARAVEAVPPLPVLRWTMLLHDLGKPATFTLGGDGQGHFYGHGLVSVRLAQDITHRLRFDSKSRRTILELVEHHDAPFSLQERPVRRLLARYGEDYLRLMLAVKRADNLAQHPDFRHQQEFLDQWETMLNLVLASEGCFSLSHLAVKGDDLLAMGLQGKVIGDTLRALLDRVIEGELPNDKQMLLEYAKEKLL